VKKISLGSLSKDTQKRIKAELKQSVSDYNHGYVISASLENLTKGLEKLSLYDIEWDKIDEKHTTPKDQETIKNASEAILSWLHNANLLKK